MSNKKGVGKPTKNSAAKRKREEKNKTPLIIICCEVEAIFLLFPKGGSAMPDKKGVKNPSRKEKTRQKGDNAREKDRLRKLMCIDGSGPCIPTGGPECAGCGG